MSDLDRLIEKYRHRDQLVQDETGSKRYSLDPTTVWSIEEFAQVIDGIATLTTAHLDALSLADGVSAKLDTALSNLEAIKGELREARGLLERWQMRGETHSYNGIRPDCTLDQGKSCRRCSTAALLALPSPAGPADPVAAVQAISCEPCKVPTGSPCDWYGDPLREVFCASRILAAQLSKTGEGTR